MTEHAPVDRVRRVGRRLKALVDPLAAAVLDAPQAADAYERLGLDHWSGYFCSRGGCLGAVVPEAAAAVLGPFEPGLVVSSLRAGWAVTEPGPVLAAREAAAAARLRELLPDAPAAGLETAAAWTGMPPALRTGIMGWPEGQAEAGRRRLAARGLLDGDAFTPAGEALRAGIEEATDRGQRDLVAALDGDAVRRLEDLLAPWGAAVVAGGGFPVDPQLLNRP